MTDTLSVRDRILEAAEKRVRGVGFHAVSFRDLASDVGIKSSSVHYHFPQKEDLGEQLVQRYSGRFHARLEQIDASGGDPLTALREFVALYGEALVVGEAVCLCAVLGAEANSLPERITGGVQKFFQSNIDWLNIVYDRIQPTMRAMTPVVIISALEGAMIVSTAMNNRAAFDAVADRILESYTD